MTPGSTKLVSWSVRTALITGSGGDGYVLAR